MAKLSKAGVKDLIAEWQKVGKQVLKAEEDLQSELAPLTRKYENATRPIIRLHEPKIERLRERQAELERQVVDWLAKQEKDLLVEQGAAIAQRKTETKMGPRVIDPQKFLIVAKRYGDKAYECVSVGIAKAEQLIGRKEVDAISTKFESTVTSCTLKLK